MNEILNLTAQIVAAHASHNHMPVSELPTAINSVYAALSNVGKPVEEPVTQQPAVPIKKSVFSDHIVCLEDGKALKMLKRHLMTSYHMTPDQYRAKWGLPSDYPMVAPDYAQHRSTLAKQIGLGRGRSNEAAPKPVVVKGPPGVRGRKPGSKNKATIAKQAMATKNTPAAAVSPSA